MPDFGIGEGLAALFGGGLGELGTLFGIGDAAAATGAGAAGLGAAEGIGAGAGASLAGLDAAGLGAASAPLALTVSPEVGAVGAGLGADLGAGAGATLAGLGGAAGGATAGFESLFGGSGAGALTTPGVSPGVGAGDLSLFNPTPVGTGVTSVGAPTAGATNVVGAPATGAAGAGSGLSAAATAAPPGVSSGLDLSSLGKFAKDWGGPLAGAAGLGYTVLNNKPAASTQALQTQANALAPQAQALTAEGNQYASYLGSGTLPPAIQSQVDSSVKSAKAQIVSRYAAQGLPTDPNRNSSLQAELQAVDQKAVEMSGQLGQQLLQSGTSLINSGAQISGLESQLLTALSGIDQTQTANLGKAIASFASALAPSKVNLQIGGHA